MYLYFNNQGVLKEIVNDDAIRQGNHNINKIRFFIEGAEPQIVNNVYKAITFITGVRTFIDVEGNQLTTESISLTTEELEIPYDKKRELKFFQYFTKYEMFSITVPDDILNESGTVGCRVQMVSAEGIITLGLIVFNVEITTGGQAIIEPDTAINIAQWNYLITHMTTPENFVMKYDADSSQWDVVPTAGSTKPVTSGGIATAIANALSAVYKIMGTATINDLNSLEKSATMNGYVYNVSDAGTLVNEDETTVSINADDNVVFVWNDGDWYWDRLGSIFDTSNLVTTNTPQTITALKIFSADAQFTGLLLGTGGSFRFKFGAPGQATVSYNSIVPSSTNHSSLGDNTYYWKDLYLSGVIHFGTNNSRITSESGILTLYGGNDGVIQCKSLVNNRGLRPETNNTYDIGSASYTYKDLYLSGIVNLGSKITFSNNPSTYYIEVTAGGIMVLRSGGNNIWCQATFVPYDNNGFDLGRSNRSWKDLYIAGAIKGAATMTQAQYDALVSGGTVDADTFYFIEEE